MIGWIPLGDHKNLLLINHKIDLEQINTEPEIYF